MNLSAVLFSVPELLQFPVVMAALLCVSATFSGAEASLFTIAANYPGQGSSSARKLLRNPASALTLILLANLLVNLAFFAASAAWSQQVSGQTAALVAAGSVLALVVFGEVLPKVLAHRHPLTASKILLLPVRLLDVLFGWLLRDLSRKFFRAPNPHSLGAAEIDSLLAEQGQIILGGDERSLLRHLLEMGFLRAGAVRKPAAEVLRVDADLPLVKARQTLREHGVAWAAVEDRSGEIRGILDLGLLPVGEYVRDAMSPVPILPEVAPLASGITLLRRSGTPFLLLVDEYGSEAGIIERGRWADTLLDRTDPTTEQGRPSVRQVSENRFLLDANIPLHVFSERFIDPGAVDPKLDTLAGLLSERLGRIPELGDQLDLDGGQGRYHPVVCACQDSHPLEIQLTIFAGEQPS
jgi:CBS domain containing-hemolysin-like protein